MQKRPIALAKAAFALAAIIAHAGALAAEGPITLYGNLYVNFESVKASGSAVSSNDIANRSRVSSNSSNIGIRGTESLGGGLEAWFQVENSVRPDSPQTGDTFASRNSGVGLKGNWGSVLLGQWDTPYKNATTRLDPFSNTSIAGYTNILGGNTTSTSANAATRQGFDRRQRNVIQYWSPDAGGLSGRIAYSANEEKGTCTVACDPSLFSMSVTYRGGPLILAAAAERHNEYANTATVRTQDTAAKFGAGYTFAGKHVLGLVWESIKYEGNLAATGLRKTFTPGTATEVKLNTYFVAYKGNFGRHNVRASYGENQELKLDRGSAVNTKARFSAIGYSYEFSKRTELMVFYSTIANQANSRNDFAVNGILGGVANNGADPKGLAAGMRHRF